MPDSDSPRAELFLGHHDIGAAAERGSHKTAMRKTAMLHAELYLQNDRDMGNFTTDPEKAKYWIKMSLDEQNTSLFLLLRGELNKSKKVLEKLELGKEVVIRLGRLVFPNN